MKYNKNMILFKNKNKMSQMNYKKWKNYIKKMSIMIMIIKCLVYLQKI
jgi:hypothetical protein